MTNENAIKVSRATLQRLPSYLRYLTEIKQDGVEIISSTTIAEKFKYNPVQVRKDLAVVSSSEGKPGAGFNVKTLISDIEHFLGYDNTNDAILVGAGGLGRTLLSYEGFQKYGLNIVLAFDVDKSLIHTEVNGKKILPMSELKDTVELLGIKIGVITVPKKYAQNVLDELVLAGIKGIWNFAPTMMDVPDGIAIKNEDMAASLALLSKELNTINNK